jgi:hypothetical protein
MRGSVLASVKALAAVMAEVREIIKIGLGKFEPALHRGKYGAKSFAVPA